MRLIDADAFRKRIDHYPPEIRNIAKKELRYTPTIEERKTGYDYSDGFADGYRQGQKDAERKTAYILVDEDGNMKCSNCGSHECWGNYCMECGAKMEVNHAEI